MSSTGEDGTGGNANASNSNNYNNQNNILTSNTNITGWWSSSNSTGNTN